MHLTKRVLSMMVAEALKGNTWAGDNVFDSPGDIGSIRVDDEGGIFIAVYCDDWDNKPESVPDEMPADVVGVNTGTFRLIIEVGAAKPLTVPGEGEDGQVTQIAATDPGLEWSIAFISRQVIDVIGEIRPAFPWSNIFNRFISGTLMRFQIRRGGSNNEGKSPAPRYASCVSILKVSTVCGEPQRGQVLPSKTGTYQVWADLLDLMTTREDLAGLAKLLRAHFTPATGIEATEIELDARRMWVSAETMASIGLASETSLRAVTTPDTGEPVRHDVPLNDQDMAEWLKRQGPDESQGTPNAG